MPRLYREAPLLSVWEGSGNVAALDTLRAMAKQPESLQVFFDELDSTAGVDSRLDTAVAELKSSFGDLDSLEHRARRVVGDMALALQGSLLVRHGDWGTVFGTLPTGIDTAAIIDRATPKVGS
jgi:putative acyl-CoA dehydrogenase